MNPFVFTDDPVAYNPDDSFQARLNLRISGVEELFRALRVAFMLDSDPDYGYSWDSWDELLSTFFWIKQKNIILVHKITPFLEDHDMELYLHVLRSAYLSWNNYESDSSHTFVILFPSSFESECNIRLASIDNNPRYT